MNKNYEILIKGLEDAEAERKQAYQKYRKALKRYCETRPLERTEAVYKNLGVSRQSLAAASERAEAVRRDFENRLG